MGLTVHVTYRCDFCQLSVGGTQPLVLGQAPNPTNLPNGWSLVGGLMACHRHRVLVVEKGHVCDGEVVA
jgi:hypothetical protein